MNLNMRLYKRTNGQWYVEFERGKSRSLKTTDKAEAKRLYAAVRAEYLAGRLSEIQQLLCHESPGTTEIYLRSFGVFQTTEKVVETLFSGKKVSQKVSRRSPADHPADHPARIPSTASWVMIPIPTNASNAAARSASARSMYDAASQRANKRTRS